MRINLNSSKYWGKIGCLNCDEEYFLLIEKGTTIDSYVQNNKDLKCRKCGCYEALRSFNEYTMTKNALLNPPQEETDGKGFGHYG